jgi:hypothetical protein
MKYLWFSILCILCILSIVWWHVKTIETFQEQSAEQYLTQKYGEYRPATEISAVSTVVQPVPELEGKEFLTVNDMKMIKLAIDNQITRLETIRSSSATYQSKQTVLEELSFRLSNILSAIDRKDASVSEFPIRTEIARQFLEKFKQSDAVPILFENIAPAPAPVVEEQPLLSLVQKLKMELQQMETSNIDATYLTRLTALEKRVLNNSMLGNPIPTELRSEFLDILKRIYTNHVIQ